MNGGLPKPWHHVLQAGGGREATCTGQPACSEACGRLLEMWDPALVLQLSHHPKVQRVMPLGARLNPDKPPTLYIRKQLVLELSHDPKRRRVVPLCASPTSIRPQTL